MTGRKVCQVTARHISHPALHAIRQVSVVMGTTGSAAALPDTECRLGSAGSPTRLVAFVSVQTGTAQS